MNLAKKFNWTLEYIDTLSIEDITMILGVLEGFNRYEKKLNSEGRS